MTTFSSSVSIDDAQGLYLNQSTAFSAALSAAPAGSTHFVLVDGFYTVWATAPFAIFTTDAAHDPPAVPGTQGTLGSWPGLLAGAGQVALFQMDGNSSVTFTGTPFLPTGVRIFQLTATAGVFFLTQFRRKVTG